MLAWLPIQKPLASCYGSGGIRGIHEVWADEATSGGVVVLGALSAVPLIGSLLTGWGLGLGAIIIGLIGLQRLTGVYPTTQPRVVALAIYAAGPIVPSMLGAGDTAAFGVYAVLPWVVHLARQLAGISVADVSTVEGDLVDGVLPVSAAQRRRMIAAIVLVTAAGGSFAPVVVLVVVMVLVLVGLFMAEVSCARSGALVCCCWSGCDELVVAVAIEPRLAVEHTDRR